MRNNYTAKRFFATGCLLQLFLIVIIIVLCLGIGHSIRHYEIKHNTTLVREVGKGVKQISNEFNKGFNADTVKVDTLKQK